MIQVLASELEDLEIFCQMDEEAGPNPWSRKSIWDSLNGNHLCLKFLIEGEICGFCILLEAGPEVEILNFVIKRDFQHRGWGRKALRQLISLDRFEPVETIWLEVREGNTRARKLYTTEGFEVSRIRKDYYRKNGVREDGIEMRLTIRKNGQ